MATLPNTSIRLYTLEPMQALTILSRANAGIERPLLYNQCMHRMALSISLTRQCRHWATLSRANAGIEHLSLEPMQALDKLPQEPMQVLDKLPQEPM